MPYSGRAISQSKLCWRVTTHDRCVMLTLMRSKMLALLSLVLTSSFYTAYAGTITGLVVFGDSLSDNGNAAIALGGPLPGNYAPNAFTDGPNTNPATAGPFGLWIDQFAALAGLPDPQPYLANPATNTNYAVASAMTGFANPQDIGNQIAAFAAAHPAGAPSNDLYVIWGGANDLYDGTSTGVTAANNLDSYIQALAADGAQHFLWLNLPQLGDTPAGAANSAALNTQSTAFDTQWATDVALLNAAGVNVTGVDVNALFNQILANPAKFGFTNVTSAAQGISGNPNNYLFWDVEHPTTAGDALIAQVALKDLTGTPEPATLAMMLAGVIGLCVFRVSRRA
jgi:phospholipase/lecithinase/hemolysin